MKIWLPITLLIVALIIAGGVALIGQKTSITIPKLPLSSPVVPETVQAKLSLVPATAQIRPGDKTMLSVNVSSTNSNVIGIETYFQYDPQVLTILSLKPGPVLPNPEILLNSIDETTGTITYALGTRQPSSGNGVLFTIEVQAKKATPGTKFPLSLNQQKTKLALETANHSKRFSQEQTVVIFEEKPLSVLL